jgi:hypothetical protein
VATTKQVDQVKSVGKGGITFANGQTAKAPSTNLPMNTPSSATSYDPNDPNNMNSGGPPAPNIAQSPTIAAPQGMVGSPPPQGSIGNTGTGWGSAQGAGYNWAAPPAPAAAPNSGNNFLSSLSDYLNQSGSTPSASDYLGAFQSSLAAARGNIQQQLAAAMGDIANNQASAQRQLATLPGSINQSFGQEGALVNNAANAIGTSQAANGIPANPTAGSNSKAGFGMNESNAAENVPEQLAMQNTKGADMANVPLLQQGIIQQGNTMRDAANMAALGDLSNLDVTGAQGALQAGTAAAQAQQAAQQQKNQFLENIFLNQMQNNAALKQQAATGNSALTAVAPGPYGTAGLTVGQVQSAHQSPDYANNISAIQSGAFSQRDYNRLQRSYPTLFNVLNTEYGNTPAWTKAKTASLSASGK